MTPGSKGENLIYSIKKHDEYLYCQWEWEGHIYRCVH